jgi:surface carbohydrate biosynthesis protein (TIGR04326 family)
MHASRDLFKRRHDIRRSLQASDDIRSHAVIDGVNCWPLVRDELAGIALLQFTWSARAMDEAAAALAALQPEIAVTYAEAGGWGRALAIESRRAGIPLAGLQHGFIYRHWLNYRHEPDEVVPDPGNAADRGFPLPARTLLFDDHAAEHLRRAGSFPADAIAVTGSPRLGELITAVRAATASSIDDTMRLAGADGKVLVVFAAKEREARAALPALVAAVGERPDLQLAIKPHPAETAGVYTAAVDGVGNIRVLPVDTPLPALLAAARGLITVNSTVAIDAIALGVPSLVIGLPNNLSPFVEAGLMLGAASAAEIREGLAKLLYDQEFRGTIERRRRAGTADAVAASAEAILSLRRPRS